jgi:2'-5' RNA ligase
MSDFAQKYTVVALLETVNSGYTFDYTDWPKHLTIAGTFAIDGTLDELEHAILTVAHQTPVTSTIVTGHTAFGPNEDIKVALVELTAALTVIQQKVVASLENIGLKFNDPQYNGPGFRPHITLQHDEKLEIGSEVSVNNLAVIDMFPDNDGYKRRVIGAYKLDA